MTRVHGTGSPVACYAISQFHISSLSDAGGSKNMHSTVLREPPDKMLQPISIVHVEDFILDFPELGNVFL